MPSFYDELKRRNVVRSGIAYVVIGWLAIQVAELVLPTFGTPDWVLKTLIFLIVLGLPFVLVFAWAFEITPDGVKKTRDVDLDDSITMSTGRKIDFVIIAGLIIALGYMIWDGQDTNAPETAAEVVEPEAPINRSIAVLPFDDMSPDGDQQWFADGLAEEILNALARTPDLLVSARNLSFAYRDSGANPQLVASELGVDHILEGSIRRGPDYLRVTAQLIRASDGFHLWSQNYDRKPDDMIAIQEDVAIEIAKALQTAMDPEALAAMMASGTASVPAYESYLHGLAYGLERNWNGDVYEYVEAINHFERAVELDPEFTQAWWQLAYWSGYTLLPSGWTYRILEIPDDEVHDKAIHALDKAIQFENDPAYRNKYRSFGATLNGRPGQALRYLNEYLSVHPNDLESNNEALAAMYQLGHHTEGWERTQSLLERHPNHPVPYFWTFQFALHLGDHELIRDVAIDALRNVPDDINNTYQAHRALLWIGDIDGASRLLPAIRNSDFGRRAIDLVELRQACAENRLGDAKRIIERIRTDDNLGVWEEWFLFQIEGRLSEANEFLRPLEESSNYLPLYDIAAYWYFDLSAFPDFQAHFESEGGIVREPLQMPYRCRFPE